MLRADFARSQAATTVYFASGSAQLGASGQDDAVAARRMAAAAPRGRRCGSKVTAIPSDTRDHALALGARRAEEVRDYLVLLGVPAAQVSAMSWGKERPGAAAP